MAECNSAIRQITNLRYAKPSDRVTCHRAPLTFLVNWLNNILIFVAAFLAVFWEAAFNPVRHLLGAQVDLLPPIMVYASLTASIGTISLLALCSGLWFDSLSAKIGRAHV